MNLSLRIAVPATVAIGLAAFAWGLDAAGGTSRDLGFALLTGAAFGIVLQRARFCFLCNLRDLSEQRDPRGVLSILAALASGLVGYTVIFGMWLPDAAGGNLPPTAFIGPVSLALVLGALAFGLGMVIAGSCISAHIYRLGEGHPTSPFALIGAFFGFILGFQTWNTLFLSDIAKGPVLWIPQHLGYAGALIAALLILAALALLALWYGRAASPGTPAPLTLKSALCAVFANRWPAIVGGVLVGVIGTFAYLRFAPLGVTNQISTWARGAANSAGILPDTLYSLDTFRGCVAAVTDALLVPNGYLVLGIVLGSFAAAFAAGKFQPSWPRPKQIAEGLIGGVLMGWGAMTALGCTIGVLLSGIHAGAVAGWVFLAVCGAAVWFGLSVRRRIEKKA